MRWHVKVATTDNTLFGTTGIATTGPKRTASNVQCSLRANIGSDSPISQGSSSEDRDRPGAQADGVARSGAAQSRQKTGAIEREDFGQQHWCSSAEMALLAATTVMNVPK